MHDGELGVEHWLLFDDVETCLVATILHLVFAVLVLGQENRGVTLFELSPVNFNVDASRIFRGVLVYLVDGDDEGLRKVGDLLSCPLVQHLLMELTQRLHLAARCFTARLEDSVRLNGLFRTLNYVPAPFLLLRNRAQSGDGVDDSKLRSCLLATDTHLRWEVLDAVDTLKQTF